MGLIVLPMSPLSFRTTAVCSADVVVPAIQTTTDANKVSSTGTPSVSGGLDLFYTVTVEVGKQTAHVEINIQYVSQSSLEVGFPGVPSDMSKFVSNVTASSDTSSLSVQYLDKDIWSIASPGTLQDVTVGYDIAKIVPFGTVLPWTSSGTEAAVYMNDLGGLLMGEYFFMVPVGATANSIKLKFALPADWQLVCPFVNHGTYFEVPKVTDNLISNFVHRQGIYFGEMRFYSEKAVGDCMVKFGVLAADQSWNTTTALTTQQDVDLFAERTALAVKKLTEIFGDNPYPVCSMYTNFCSDQSGTYSYPGTREIAGGYQYWPSGRYDELIGHLLYSWLSFPTGRSGETPALALDFISKGLGESYLGCRTAYQLTGDKAYLGELYQYYLVYKRALNTAYMSKYEIGQSYYKGAVFGIYLDDLIQKETNNLKSIEDVYGYLYRKYKNTDHCIQIPELQAVVDAVTGKDHTAIFNKYVYGDEEIPVQGIIQPYEESFDAFLKELESDDWGREYHGYAISAFMDIEMAIPLASHIPVGLLIDSYYKDFAKYIFANYSVDALTKADVETSLGKLTGQDCTGFFDRWKDSYGELTLDEMKDWLRSYMPYAPQGLAGTFQRGGVTLNWNSVQQRYGSGYYLITGYALYKGSSPCSESFLANVGTNTTYTDTSVVAGQTYYYCVKSIEDQPFGDGQHMSSEPSAELTVVYQQPAASTVMVLQIGARTFTVDGKTNTLDSPPVIKNGRTLVPIRAIIEALGGTVGWDGAARKATVTLGSTSLQLWIGKSAATVNGTSTPIDSTNAKVVPEIINGRTMLPLRFVSENLGAAVGWDQSTQTITITYAP